MGAHVRLREQDVLVRVDAGRQQHRRHLARLLRKLLWVLPLGDRVQVDHAVDALVAVLQRDPVADCAEIVAQMGDAGRLDAGEHAFHGAVDGRCCAEAQGESPGANRPTERSDVDPNP